LGVLGGLSRGTFNESGIPSDFFGDVDVRKGFAYCINYTRFIDEALLGEAFQPATPIIWGLPFYNAEQEKYSLDLTKAEKHFKVAWGDQLWANGFRMTLAYNKENLQYQEAFEMIKAGIESLNSKFHVDVGPLNWTEFLPQRRQGQLPMFLGGWLADFADPHDFAYGFMYSHGDYPLMQRYANATVDALIEAGMRELDSDRRKQIYYDLQSLYHEDCPSVPLYQDRGRRVERDWVQGWYYNPLVSVNYFYAQWKEENPPTEVNAGSNTVDRLGLSDTIVLINVTATGNVSVSKHDINLEGTIPADIINVKSVIAETTLDHSEIVFPIEIRIYLTDQDVKSAHIVQSTLSMYYWNGTGWIQENNTGVVLPSDVSGYAGYVWARTTRLSMFALIGKPPPTGDINLDGTVDLYDAIMLAGTFNSRPGSPTWNTSADLNGDNVVDIYDAIILAGNYGKTA
jgi:hypothetical protein